MYIMIVIFSIITTTLILMFAMMEYQYLSEDGFDFLVVGHHVNEEVDSNLKCFFSLAFQYFNWLFSST